MNTSHLIVLVVAVAVYGRPTELSITHEQQQQQQQGQDEEARRREAERAAAERARQEEMRRQSEARREEFKRVKSLQDRTDVIFKYVLFEGQAPKVPANNFLTMTLEERVRLVDEMSSTVSAKVREWVDAQKRSVVDIRQASSLLTDLQTLKHLLQSMHR